MDNTVPGAVLDRRLRVGRPDHDRGQEVKLLSYFRALGERHRLDIFVQLMESELCVCELEERVRLSPSLLAHHLKVLRGSGLIQVRRGVRDARWLYYSINPAAFAELRRLLSGLFHDRELPPEARPGSSNRCG